MSEQLTQMQNLLEQLVQMVGNNNTAIEELRQDMQSMKANMATKEDIAKLDAKMATKADLEKITSEQQKDFEAILDIVNRKLDSLPTREELHSAIAEQQKDVIATLRIMDKRLTDIQEDMKSLFEITGEHEVKIRSLSRRPV